MTTQYVYTQEEHQEAIKNKLVKEKLEKLLEKGFFYKGLQIRDINEFLIMVKVNEV